MDKVRFSIGGKLILIIAFFIIISFTLTAIFIYRHVYNDLSAGSQAVNSQINRFNSAEADSLISNILSASKTFIQTVNVPDVSQSVIQNASNAFFAENKSIGGVYFINSGNQAQTFINRQFFASSRLNDSLAYHFFDSSRYILDQAMSSHDGKPVIINASPFFSVPALALFFPAQTGIQAAVFFSSENISNDLSYGVNTSWLINSYGDVLAYPDFFVLINGINISDFEFFNNIVNGWENSGKLSVTADISKLQPPLYAAEENIIAIFWEVVNPVIQSVLNWIKTFLFNINLINDNPAAGNFQDQFFSFTKLDSANAVAVTVVNNDHNFNRINAVTGFVVCLSAVILVILIIVIELFSKSISDPLRLLSAAAKRIENGDFSHEIKIKNRDETGVLASGFNRMSLALYNFGKFTNRDIVLKTMRGDIAPYGIPKHCTVLFSDIHDFAVKSDNFYRFFGNEGSDKILKWLNEYFSKMIDCVDKTNGVTDKLIGDALMAHWGTAYTTGSPRNDAFVCVKAALMMRKALFILNKTRRKNDNSDPFISIGCGISSGIATAGQIGSDKHVEYTVIGNPVNIAAQIGSYAKTLGADILISEETYNLVGDKFKTLEMQPVIVKGKDKPVKIYAVINFLRESKGPQDIDDVRNLLGITVQDTK